MARLQIASAMMLAVLFLITQNTFVYYTRMLNPFQTRRDLKTRGDCNYALPVPVPLSGHEKNLYRPTPQRTPLRDIHIAMIGDSLMRYQYLSLAYRLRYGIWFNESQWYYNLVNEKTFQDPFHSDTWGEFLYHTNRLLQPHEVCDCRRHPNMPWNKPEIIENRYYYDPVLNNSIVLILAYGHQCPVKGRLAPTQIRNLKRDSQMRAFQDFTNFTWRHYDWTEVIKNHIQYLDPQPRHIIMNAGYWRHKFGWSQLPTSNQTGVVSNETETMFQLVQDLPQYEFAWRTTTYQRDRLATSSENDHIMCKRLGTCLNVSFTRYVRKNLFWDNKHFLEPVYRFENEEMLDQLGYLPSDYVRMNVSDILE